MQARTPAVPEERVRYSEGVTKGYRLVPEERVRYSEGVTKGYH
jgi:hypothetical protein